MSPILLSICILLALVVIFGSIFLANTHFRRLKSDLTHIQDQMLGMEKLASQGQLSAVLAHEIKNPLNFVINFSQGAEDVIEELENGLLEYQNTQSPEALQQVQEILLELRANNQYIQNNGLRVDRIINQVMRRTQAEVAEKAEAQLNQVVDEQLNWAKKAFSTRITEHGIRFVTRYDDSIPPLYLHVHELSRVVINLIDNATFAVEKRAFKEKQGYIPTIEVRTLWEGDHVRIFIRDNGMGIPDKIKNQVFAPFFTTKSAKEGNSGLGLAISQDIISELFQGEITVQSQSHNFTEFDIRFPVPQRVG